MLREKGSQQACCEEGQATTQPREIATNRDKDAEAQYRLKGQEADLPRVRLAKDEANPGPPDLKTHGASLLRMGRRSVNRL
jgi:hypothetical protein